jgi:hypothetical protein
LFESDYNNIAYCDKFIVRIIIFLMKKSNTTQSARVTHPAFLLSLLLHIQPIRIYVKNLEFSLARVTGGQPAPFWVDPQVLREKTELERCRRVAG